MAILYSTPTTTHPATGRVQLLFYAQSNHTLLPAELLEDWILLPFSPGQQIIYIYIYICTRRDSNCTGSIASRLVQSHGRYPSTRRALQQIHNPTFIKAHRTSASCHWFPRPSHPKKPLSSRHPIVRRIFSGCGSPSWDP